MNRIARSRVVFVLVVAALVALQPGLYRLGLGADLATLAAVVAFAAFAIWRADRQGD